MNGECSLYRVSLGFSGRSGVKAHGEGSGGRARNMYLIGAMSSVPWEKNRPEAGRSWASDSSPDLSAARRGRRGCLTAFSILHWSHESEDNILCCCGWWAYNVLPNEVKRRGDEDGSSRFGYVPPDLVEFRLLQGRESFQDLRKSRIRELWPTSTLRFLSNYIDYAYRMRGKEDGGEEPEKEKPPFSLTYKIVWVLYGVTGRMTHLGNSGRVGLGKKSQQVVFVSRGLGSNFLRMIESVLLTLPGRTYQNVVHVVHRQ